MIKTIVKFFVVVLMAGWLVYCEERWLPLNATFQAFIRFSVILVLTYVLLGSLQIWRLFGRL